MNKRKLSEKELCLVRLVHMLSAGTLQEYGLSLEEVLDYLQKPIPRMRNRNALELIDSQGLRFIKDLERFLEDS